MHLSLSTSPLVERHPAYSSTLLAFCGGPKVSGVLAEARSTVELRKLRKLHEHFLSIKPNHLFGRVTFLQSLLPQAILHIDLTLSVKVTEDQSPMVVLLRQKRQARKRSRTRVFGMWSEKKLLRL